MDKFDQIIFYGSFQAKYLTPKKSNFGASKVSLSEDEVNFNHDEVNGSKDADKLVENFGQAPWTYLQLMFILTEINSHPLALLVELRQAPVHHVNGAVHMVSSRDMGGDRISCHSDTMFTVLHECSVAWYKVSASHYLISVIGQINFWQRRSFQVQKASHGLWDTGERVAEAYCSRHLCSSQGGLLRSSIQLPVYRTTSSALHTVKDIGIKFSKQINK